MKYNEVELQEIAEFKNGKKRPDSKGKIPVYGGNGVLDYTDEYNAEKGSIIIGRVGAYCGSIYKTFDKCWISDNAIMCKNKGNNDFLYLYYLLKKLDLNRLHIGSSQPLLTQNILNSIKVVVPENVTQYKIGYILSKIDDKIELNNKINENLQSISQLLFKHWFVDFEFPNEEGLPYKSSGGEMIDSELGLIPKEWNVTPLGDVMVLNYGKALTSKDRMAGDVKVYSSAGHTGFHNKALIESDGIIVGRKGTIGTVYYARDRFYCIDTAYYITQKDCKLDLIWSFELLKQLKLKELNEDSAVPGLNRNTLYSQKIVVPTNKVAEKLNNILSSIIRNMFHYSDENEILSNLRDTLLPKLMNGEIDVSKMEINQ